LPPLNPAKIYLRCPGACCKLPQLGQNTTCVIVRATKSVEFHLKIYQKSFGGQAAAADGLHMQWTTFHTSDK